MQAIQGIILIIGVIFAHSVSATSSTSELKCEIPEFFKDLPNDWVSMADPCTLEMKKQVKEELTAAMTYMAMGAHFARDTINRPGFSKMFFESASEEREHAIKIIEYLLMRGELTSSITKLINNPTPLASVFTEGLPLDGVDALKAALKLEARVTNKIRNIIEVCEKAEYKDGVVFNDYHLVDYLTGDFLEEQYRGQRDIAGKLSTLHKMMQAHGPLGEFLFDKKLLNGSPI